MILLKTPSFIRMARILLKRNPDLASDFERALNIMSEDVFDTRLKTHKLKGTLSGSYGCSVNYSIRIIFQIVQEEDPITKNKQNAILLESIGTHDLVY
jgi:mRNA-degrading endonuclease YafQ of YafQ-DinJ toxin-antitoxin module